MTMHPFRKRCRLSGRVLLCLLLAALLPAAGCASKYGAQTTTVSHYPDCYAPINELRQSEHSAPKYAAGGAAAGAVLGALIGYLATGKSSGALVGGAAGAVAGGAAGGIYGQHSQTQDDAERLAAYNSQLEGNIRETSRMTAAAKLARQCYERQFAVAASEYKAGRLTKEQFNSRYIEVTNGMQEAASLLGQSNKRGSEISAEYERALQQESMRVANAGSGKNAPKASAEERRKLSNLKTKSTAMQRSVSAGEEEERQLMQRLSITHRQAQDLMS